MATTLGDSFLSELDELSDNEAPDFDENVGKEETLNSDHDLDSVSNLHKTQRYADIMQKVEEALENETVPYKLIMDCNQLLVDIEDEITIVHNFIRYKYRLKFQELESLVPQAIDYARVVKQIGNETDLTLVDLKDLLKQHTIMTVKLAASTTKGKPLPEDVLQKTMDACDRAIDLDSAKKKILEFTETKMVCIAPNLSAIVGCAVAAKLMGTAGGLSELANMPACHVRLLGKKRKSLDGFSSAATQSSRVGYLEQTEIFQSTPPELRLRVSKLLACKSTLAARIDAVKGDPSGKNGKAFREEIRNKIDKLQEPCLARQPKQLPVPNTNPKKRRGGRRLRKTKERYAVTEMRKQANRVAFGETPEESSLGYGMLGQAQSKRLRMSSVPSNLKAKVAKKVRERQYSGGTTTYSGFMTSSLAFTPVKGTELRNPHQALGFGSGTQRTYFSKFTTFSKLNKI
ncbi:hypothetical protein EUTSA_v10003005mg [Eutrema salsugineum]|uniref:Nop domain-containing protein n=1 Tax=Eutrema salsugineum TaxID=72664 RepID=V4L1F9_EUTSA|nr:hypothetical protein EUTSA_v10003005mg [Eutrema salsugineum]